MKGPAPWLTAQNASKLWTITLDFLKEFVSEKTLGKELYSLVTVDAAAIRGAARVAMKRC